MNGITSSNSLLTKSNWEQEKKKFIAKCTLALITTNIATALLFSPMETKVEKKGIEIPAHFTKLLIRSENSFILNQGEPISILNLNNHPIIEKAIFLKKENAEQTLVAIPNDQTLKIRADGQLRIVPFLEGIHQKKKTISSPRKNYEEIYL